MGQHSRSTWVRQHLDDGDIPAGQDNAIAIFIAPRAHYRTPEESLPRRAFAPIIIPDGNARSGYRGSACKVVEVCEHCAALPHITQLTIFLLSGQNILRRSSGALSQVAATVWQVRALVQQSGALRRAGVRCTLVGSLARIERRGEAGAAIAAGLRSLINATAAPDNGVTNLTLQLAIDCDDSLIQATQANALLRTAAECSGVFRPSSITLPGGIMCVAEPAPWPKLDADAIDRAVQASSCPPSWSRPYEPSFIGHLLTALGSPQLASLDLHVPITGASGDLRTDLALRRLLRARHAVLQLADGTTIGGVATSEARIRIYLSPADTPTAQAGANDAMVLPNQRASALWLPPTLPPRRWFSLHTCGPEPPAIAQAINEAATFRIRHPPLYGADRFVAQSTRVARPTGGAS